MTDQNRRLVLAEHPSGMVDDRTVGFDEAPVPDPEPGQGLDMTPARCRGTPREGGHRPGRRRRCG